MTRNNFLLVFIFVEFYSLLLLLLLSFVSQFCVQLEGREAGEASNCGGEKKEIPEKEKKECINTKFVLYSSVSGLKAVIMVLV